jgi:L-rhamnose isomerase
MKVCGTDARPPLIGVREERELAADPLAAYRRFDGRK